MLVVASNSRVVFALDVNQCNLSWVYCTANLDLLSLFLSIDSLPGFALISET